MFGLTGIDIVVIIAYLLIITYIGVRSSRSVSDTGDFFMGGRRFGKLFMVAKAFGVGTRVDQVVAVTGASYEVGLSGIWYQWLYIFSTPFYWLITPVYRRLRYLTTGDFFEERYGRAAGSVYTLVALLYFCVTIGMVLRGTGTTIEALTGGKLSGNLTIIIVTAIFVLYSASGGLVAAIRTKVLQGMLLLLLSVIVLPFGFARVGGFSGLHDKLTADLFSLIAGKEVTFFFIVMATVNALVGVVAMPHHMAIGGAARDEISSRTGWTYGNMTKRLATIAWGFGGILALALFPGIASAEREQAFGLLITQLLPAGLVGLAIAAMLASVMAICDTYMIDGAALFTRNFYRNLSGEEKEEKHYLKIARFSSVAVVAVGILIAFQLPDVVTGLKTIWKIMAFMGISFWMAIFWKRGNRYGFLASVVVTAAAALYTQSLGWSFPQQVSLYLPAGFFAFIVVSLLTLPEPEEKMYAFYTLLHTPVGEEYRLKKKGIHIIHEGIRRRLEDIDKEDKKASLEERGHSLILVDLLELPRKFRFSRYRVDILGFAAAWCLVFLIILLAIGLSRIGI